MQSLRDEVCALKAQSSNWHTLLQKARNRLAALENTVKTIPTPQPQTVISGESEDCDSLIETNEANSIIVCHSGERKAMPPDDEGVNRITSCNGKWSRDDKGKMFYPLETPLHTSTSGTAGTVNVELDLNAHIPEEFRDCADLVFASVSFYGYSARTGTGVSPSYYIEYSYDNGVTWRIVGRTAGGSIIDGTGAAAILRLREGKLKYRYRNLNGFGIGSYSSHITGLFL